MRGAIAERLKLLRARVGYSQKEVGQIIGVSQAAINRYELDIAMPMHEKLLHYTEHFDVSLDYVYGRTDNPQGMLFDYEPDALKEQFSDREQMERFIEFCFEPESAGNEKLKTVLADMLGADRLKKKKGVKIIDLSAVSQCYIYLTPLIDIGVRDDLLHLTPD
jgi:transcriptional regulator with XRE-family HTH domain